MHQIRHSGTTRPAPDLEEVREHYSEIYVIVSPPRGSSTALARVFWEHPSVRYYCHEPFEIAYFRDAPLDEVKRKLLAPLDVSEICGDLEPGADALVVKEMPYQVDIRFPLLAGLATAPIVFLVRDPRLNIASRIAKKLEAGADPSFPVRETGWNRLQEQVDYCREHGVPHLVLTSEDLRDRPLSVLPRVFARLGLEFDETMITWTPCADVEIDNLEGEHSHLYRKVLTSAGIQPELDSLPPVRSFPEEGGFREHVVDCLAIYDELRESPARIGARRSTPPRP